MKKTVISILLLLSTSLLVRSQTDSLFIAFKSAFFEYDIGKMQLLLKEGADINAKNSDGNTLVHQAVLNYDTTLLEILKYLDADFSIANNLLQTPRQLAEKQQSENKYSWRDESINALVTFLKNPVLSANFYTRFGTFSEMKRTVNLKRLNTPDKQGFTVLYYAIWSNVEYAEKISYLIANKANVNFNFGNLLDVTFEKSDISLLKTILSKTDSIIPAPPLIYAIRLGNFDVVKILIEKGADIDGKDYFRKPLFITLEQDNFEMFKYLIDNNADPNVMDYDEESLIEYVLGKDDERYFNYLLTGNLVTNVRTKDSVSLLQLACGANNFEGVKLILSKNPDINEKDLYGKTPLHYFCDNKTDTLDINLLQLLLSSGADVNAADNDGNTPLICLAMDNNSFNYPILEKLILAGAKVNMVNKYHSSALLFICSNLNSEQAVKLMIEKGADVNLKNDGGTTALLNVSVQQDGYESFLLLTANKADINVSDNKGYHALHYIAGNRNGADMCKHLVTLKVQLNPETPDKATPLDLAVVGNNQPVIDILIAAGAIVSATPEKMKLAIQANNLKMVMSVLDNKFPIDTVDIYGHTALTYAIFNNNYNITNELIKSGASVNPLYSTFNPLSLAVEKNNLELVKLLIANNARAILYNEYFENPIHLAAANQNSEMVLLLKQHLIGEEMNKKSKKNIDNTVITDFIVSDIVPIDTVYNVGRVNNQEIIKYYGKAWLQISDVNDFGYKKLIYSKLISPEYKSYTPVNSEYGYMLQTKKSASVKDIRERMGARTAFYEMFDNEGNYYDQIVNIEPDYRVLNGIVFNDSWNFSGNKFTKNVKTLTPVARLTNENYDDYNEGVRYNLVSTIFSGENSGNKKNKDNWIKFNQIKYEFIIGNTEIQTVADIETDWYLYLEKENSPEFTSVQKKRLVYTILNEVLSANTPAFDFFNGQKLTVPEVRTRLGEHTESVLVYDMEFEMVEQLVKVPLSLREIKSVIFIEDWYTNIFTGEIKKEIIGIAPVRYSHLINDYESDQLNVVKSVPFVYYFNGLPTDRTFEKNMRTHLFFDKFYPELNPNDSNMYFQSKKAGDFDFNKSFFDKFRNLPLKQLKDLNLTNADFLASNMENLSNTSKDSIYNNIENKEIAGISSNEKWYFNPSTYNFYKKVISYAPFYTFLPDEMPVFKKLPLIYSGSDNNKPDKNTHFRSVTYEHKYDNFENYFDNNEVFESKNPLFYDPYSYRFFKDILHTDVVSGKVKVYDFNTNQYLDSLKVQNSLTYRIDTVLVENDWGELNEVEIHELLTPEMIKSVIFMEDWFINPENFAINKKVNAIVPVYYLLINEQPAVYEKRMPYIIYLDNRKGF